MCSTFTQRGLSNKDVAEQLAQGTLDIRYAADSKSSKIVPRRLAQVVCTNQDKRIVLSEMQFALIPRWSKESKIKFATHNARIESVDEKASFKDAFQKRHCVVPMEGFIEPIYIGPFAGNMIEFYREDERPLLAAGIWEEWLSKTTGEVIESFSILTSEPIPFVEKNGHDRSPIFLNPNTALEWLGSENEKPLDLKEFLLGFRETPPLNTRIERPLKEGWQKRI